MTETIRYSKIYLEDLALGGGTREVTLADGRVVTLSEITNERIAAALPSVNASIVLFTNSFVYASAHESLLAAVNAAGTTISTICISTVTTVTASLTIPSNVTIWFLASGRLSINSGVTVTIAGPLIAPSSFPFS